MKLLNIIKPKLAFEPVDPLDDGLREMIQGEQREPQAINLHDDDTDIGQFWHAVERDIHNGGALEFAE